MTSDASTEEPPELGELLWQHYSSLLSIKRRLHVLLAYSKAAERISRGKPFRIRNDIVFHTILDVRDKCVIDLYSRTVAMRHGVEPLHPKAKVSTQFMAKMGLFYYIRENHLSHLCRRYEPSDGDDDYIVAQQSALKEEVFKRRFPNCSGETPSTRDIEELCEEFRIKMRPLGDDRNKNRAHPFEEKGTARMHSFDELSKLFDFAEDLLEDLSLLGRSTSFARQDMNRADSDRTAEDLFFHILFGDHEELDRLTGSHRRKHLIEHLHDLHEARDNEELFFNDMQFDISFEPSLTSWRRDEA